MNWLVMSPLSLFVFTSFHASPNCLVYFIMLCTLSFLLTYTIHDITMPNFIYGFFKCKTQVMASSSQGSASRKKARPVRPISIDDDGYPFGPHYDALTDHISSHVCHCDQFSPILKWADHKRVGRVQALYKDIAVSIIMFY